LLLSLDLPMLLARTHAVVTVPVTQWTIATAMVYPLLKAALRCGVVRTARL